MPVSLGASQFVRELTKKFVQMASVFSGGSAACAEKRRSFPDSLKRLPNLRYSSASPLQTSLIRNPP